MKLFIAKFKKKVINKLPVSSSLLIIYLNKVKNYELGHQNVHAIYK